MRILWEGSRGVTSFVKKSLYNKKTLELRSRSEETAVDKHKKENFFADGWLAAGSYSVEPMRATSRKLLQGFPGLQDLKNKQKTTKNVQM